MAVSVHYQPELSPSENIESFFEAFKIQNYELVKPHHKEKAALLLLSEWSNEEGLRIVMDVFYKGWMDALYEMSTDHSKSEDYFKELRRCDRALKKANFFMDFNVMDVRIVRKGNTPDKDMLVKFDSLPKKYRVRITNCFMIAKVFFRSLTEQVKEELIHFTYMNHVRESSYYEWNQNKFTKRQFSELMLALIETGAIRQTDGNEFSRKGFASFMAAQFGISQLNFEQDISGITFSATRSPLDFLDKMRDASMVYFRKRQDK